MRQYPGKLLIFTVVLDPEQRKPISGIVPELHRGWLAASVVRI
jgi:hypothetical protein